MSLPRADPPVSPPQRPSLPVPEGAWDTHVHLVAPPGEFPLWEGRVEDPAPGPESLDAWLDIYRAHLVTLGCARGVIVHSILYGPDNTVTCEAVRRMGPGFVGVGLVPDGAPEAALDRLADARVKAVRLNYVHGGILSWEGALALSPALAERGMHIQMLAHAHLHMADLADAVRACPVPVVFDHLGWPDLALGPYQPGLVSLRRLMAEGHAWVKLSAPYRMAPAPWTAADEITAAFAETAPERCLWGSDWPHLMLGGAAMPDAGALMDAFARAVPDPDRRRRILVETPEALYGPA